ncbi:MAG: hypothetical protein ACRETB_01935 [Steroidobacteraceae bacterium]
MRRSLGIALGIALALLATGISAQESSEARVRAFAGLPNWSGLWETAWNAADDNPSGYPPGDARDRVATLRKYVELFGKPPYSAAWIHEQRTEAKSRASGQVDHCSFPFPILLEAPNMFQAYVTPEETLFLYDDGMARHIYTDGRKHPDKADLWPTALGNSIGHWDGTTLVIDTIETQPGPIFAFPGAAALSAQAHFTERVRMIDHDTMQDDLTLDDPARFIHPWRVSIRWHRVRDQDRMIPRDCANNRNPVVNGKITFAPP